MSDNDGISNTFEDFKCCVVFIHCRSLHLTFISFPFQSWDGASGSFDSWPLNRVLSMRHWDSKSIEIQTSDHDQIPVSISTRLTRPFWRLRMIFSSDTKNDKSFQISWRSSLDRNRHTMISPHSGEPFAYLVWNSRRQTSPTDTETIMVSR